MNQFSTPATHRSPDRPLSRSVIILIALAAVLRLVTIDADHVWGDFAMYTMHARNIATGAAYGQTPYIYNPGHAGLGPPAYPPVFPALLAPVVYFFGLSLRAMKAESVAFFSLFLFFVYACFRRDLTIGSALLLVASIAFNPFSWDMQNRVGSDIPFLALFYGALLAIERLDSDRRSPVLSGIVLGTLTYLCYGTRAIGIVLLPSMVVRDLLRDRRPSKQTLVAGAVFVFGFMAQAILIPGVGGYVDQLRADPSVLLTNGIFYARELSYLFFNGHSRTLRLVLMGTAVALGGVGFWMRARRKLTIFEIFPFFYLSIILVWPAIQGLRFLMPLVPLLFFYAFYALDRSSLFRAGVARPVAAVAFSLALALSYVGEHRRVHADVRSAGVYGIETQEMFSFVRENVGADDVVIFRKPRAFALFTGRRTAVYHTLAEDPELWDYFAEIGATIIVGARWDEPYFKDFLERNHERFDEMFSNSEYSVLRILNPPPPAGQEESPGLQSRALSRPD